MSTSSSSSNNIGEQRIAGSLEHPFKLAIVGGGPSGCSILVRAARIGMLPELCQFSSSNCSSAVCSIATSTSDTTSSSSTLSSPAAKVTSVPSVFSSPQRSSQSTSPSKASIDTAPQQPPISYAGVCVIDGGTMERIGGGRLQDYVINSNTWINKFATNATEEKLDNLPPETIKGTPFDSLLHSSSTKQVEDFGNKTGPLKLVGHFLRDVGQRTVAAVQAYPSSSKFFIRTNVESMQRVVENGMFKYWKLVLVTVNSQTTDGNGNNSAVQEKKEIYALHVAMATGGHQTLPHFTNASYRQKTMLSDVVCTMEGVELLKTKLHRYLRTCHNNGTAPTGRVVVIGGSHSAFSAAWVCLNLVNEDSTVRLAINGGNSNNVASSSYISTNSAPISLNSQNQLKFGPSGVCILHRSAIRVFYATRADADHDHYPESSIVVNRITGNINPFGGIRGDAKELWRNIRSTKEGRVRLLQVKHIPLAAPPNESDISNPSGTFIPITSASSSSTSAALKQSIVEKLLDEAVVIIWAAGYATNMIPIYDHDGSRIQVRISKGQAEVDEHANLLLSEQHHGQSPLSGFLPSMTLQSYASLNHNDFQGIPVGNLYGSGLGYGLKATLDNGEPDGASGRADGVAVYLKRGATLILANVLGNKVYGGLNIHSWEERNQALKRQQKQQDQSPFLLNMTQNAASSEGGPIAVGSKTPSCNSNCNKSPSRRSSSFMTPTRVATAYSEGPICRVLHHPHSYTSEPPPSTAIGMRSPQAPQTSAAATTFAQGRRPSSVGRIRVDATSTSSSESSSTNINSLKTTAMEIRQQHTQDKEKMALIRNVATHVRQQQLETVSNNQATHSDVVNSISEPCTPSTTHHPTVTAVNTSNNKSTSRIMPLPGSAGRTVVSSISTPPRSGTSKSNPTSEKKAQKISHAHALRSSIDNAMLTASSTITKNNHNHHKTSNSADRKQIQNINSSIVVKPLKPMPGPLPLPMGSVNFMLPPEQTATTAIVTSSPNSSKSPVLHNLNGHNRTLLSSSIK